MPKARVVAGFWEIGMAKWKRLASAFSLVALTGCSNTLEAQYSGPKGVYGSGQITQTVTQSDVKLSIKNDGVTCSGSYPTWNPLTIVFPVSCTDGRKGSATLTRPFEGPMSGQGSIQFADGETRQIVYVHPSLKR